MNPEIVSFTDGSQFSVNFLIYKTHLILWKNYDLIPILLIQISIIVERCTFVGSTGGMFF
jgi:hypothetical protein